MFYDLNVPWRPNDAELLRTLNFLYELGYNVVACSHTISGKLNADLTCPIPNPLPFASALPPRLQILRRCTLLMSESPAATTPRLNQLAAQYDILAVRPVDEKTFQQACTTLDCDLISLDASQRLGFILKHRTLSAALQRGVRLELCYAGAGAGGGSGSSMSTGTYDVNAAAARRNLITNATALIRATRGGRGLVISSEAHRAASCRAPWDVVNLAVVWGLGQDRAKEAVANTARAVVVTARLKRSSYRGAVDVVGGGGDTDGGGKGGKGRCGGGSGGSGTSGTDGKYYDDDDNENKRRNTSIPRKRRALADDTPGNGAASASASASASTLTAASTVAAVSAVNDVAAVASQDPSASSASTLLSSSSSSYSSSKKRESKRRAKRART